MTKLVDEHLAERVVIAGGDSQLVIDAAATIGVTIDQHDDVLEGHARQHIIQAVNVLGHQVAVAIERVVVGANGCRAPAPQVWHTRSASE